MTSNVSTSVVAQTYSSVSWTFSSDDGDIKRYADKIQLLEIASSGSGTDADPYIIDFTNDVFLNVSAETELIVDGVFKITTDHDIPPQYTLTAPVGRPETEHGGVIRAQFGSSITGAMFNYVDDGVGLAASNGGGAIGVYFDANEEADKCTEARKVRTRWFHRCSFRFALNYGFDTQGRNISVFDCNIGDHFNGWGARVDGSPSRQVTFRGCRFVSNNQHLTIIAPFGRMTVDDCTFEPVIETIS